MSIKKIDLGAPWDFVNMGDDGWIIDNQDRYLVEVVKSDDEERFVASDEKRAQIMQLMAEAPRMLNLLQCVQDMMVDQNDRDELDVQEQGLLADIGTCIEAAAPYPVQWPDEWKREGWKL